MFAMLPMATNDATNHPSDENYFLDHLHVPAPEIQIVTKRYAPTGRLYFVKVPVYVTQTSVL